jgi:hypothetical protein
MARAFSIKEGNDYTVRIKPLVSTLNKTLSVRAYPVGGGSSVELGTLDGGAEDATFDIELVTSNLDVGNYYLEFFANYGLGDVVVLNNGGENIILIVENMGSI